MPWMVEVLEEVRAWLAKLDRKTADQVGAAVDCLEDQGPSLGRPLVDSVSGSRYRNMKELRPGSSGRSEIRILFAFDPDRCAVLLVAGDKAGKWRSWYRNNIPVADRRFGRYLAERAKEGKEASDG